MHALAGASFYSPHPRRRPWSVRSCFASLPRLIFSPSPLAYCRTWRKRQSQWKRWAGSSFATRMRLPNWWSREGFEANAIPPKTQSCAGLDGPARATHIDAGHELGTVPA